LDALKLEHKALDRQLLDAVSQKLQLSQQLEAWQVGHVHQALAFGKSICRAESIRTTES